MMRRVAIACLAMFLAAMAAPARAGLVLYAQDTTLSSGGSGYLNIYLAGLPTDTFDTYSVTLSITPKAGTTGTVIFAPNGSAPDPANAAMGQQPYNYLFAASYIFSGDTLNGIAGVNGGIPALTSMSITDSSLSGSEYAAFSSNAPTLANPGTLLASLLIDAVTTNPGDQYSVGLVSASFTSNTAPVGAPTLGSTANFSGLIAISSVPEPASIVSSMTALLILAGLKVVRRRRTAVEGSGSTAR